MPVAHQFDDAEQQRDAATLGMWLFLGTEVLLFGGMFLGYTVYRGLYSEAFVAGSRQLSLVLGAVNTAVLLSSSLTMALAVHAAQTGKKRAIVGFLLATIVLGSVFLGVKGYEYFEKFKHHLVPGARFAWDAAHGAVQPGHAELFFSFYFAMTGMHALHMVIGVCVLAGIAVLAGRGRFSAQYFTPVELAGMYWHFVDIVWVFLFPLLYLIN